jgi:regulator of sigma E protease
MFNFLLVFFSLFFLIILHEFSHFLAAKKSNVFVEEFGIGLPPRILGKKIGETIYSLNLLPFGAFVKLEGEIGESGFGSQPLFKRMIIVLAGVISFWIIAWIIFIFLFKFGMPIAISDDEISPQAKVQIIAIAKNSPAQISGLRVGDKIIGARHDKEEFKIEKVKEIQEFTQKYKGEKILLKIERGKEIFDLEIVPRTNPPPGEGPMGIVLSRIEIKKYPLWNSIIEGTKTTGELTLAIVKGYFLLIKNLIKGISPQAEITGPVGIFNMMYQTSKIGISYFFHLLATLSIYLAVFNSLPIPALDGGKFLFLLIEGVRKKPISPEIERKVTAFFFTLLIMLALWITIKDVTQILNQ